ncbi:MAG TPA: hypothetical protein VEI29_05495, partial [Burkholderiaceae bacterium]|nr:hypothetical protein [Burkholderiaceae bacterium]
GVVVPIDSALASEHAKARALVVQTGDVPSVGTPIKFSRSCAQMRCPPPVFAADGEAILRESGFSSAQIDDPQAGVLLRAAPPRAS